MGTLTAANYSFNFVPGTLTVKVIGDITGSTGSPDGVFDLADALAYLRIALHQDPTPANIAGVDLAPVINGVPQGDGKINVGDAVAALEHLVGLW
jgi:hypothetical protein